LKIRRLMTGLALTLVASAGLLAISVGGPVSFTDASSHRESPMTQADPLADATDLYAFTSPDAPDTVTLIANWVPLEEPADGPNFYQFGDAPDYVYGIKIDNNGDALPDVGFEWKFTTQIQNPNTFLYNTGPITSLDDPDFNFRQVYTLTRIDYATNMRTVLGTDIPTPPNFIGPRSEPDYASLSNAAIKTLSGGYKTFAGPVDDPFFVDLGSITDVLALRNPGSDTVSGFNTHSVVLQAPKSLLVQDGCNLSDEADKTSGDCVIGIWSTTDRPQVDVLGGAGGLLGDSRIFGDLNCDNVFGPPDLQQGLKSFLDQPVKQATDDCPDIGKSNMVQVSRLGNPLVNEVVIPVGKKDIFNRSQPKDDAQFASYVTDPELAGLLNLIYNGILTPIPASGRTDLVTVFLTGVPTLTQPANVVASEELRLNVTTPVSQNPSPLGVLGGDFQGFPNGRRLTDDVTDIALRAVACGYGAVYTVFDPFGPCNNATFGNSPNNTAAVSDNVNANDKPFSNTFPYEAQPNSGFDHAHDQEDHHTSILPAGVSPSLASAGMGLIGLLIGLAVVAPKLLAPVRRRFNR
jgi:hypothetical protein